MFFSGKCVVGIDDSRPYFFNFIRSQGNLSSKRRQAILGIFQKMDKGNTGEVSTEELGVHYNAKGDPEVQEGSKSGRFHSLHRVPLCCLSCLIFLFL